jgi:hypothetical protein
MKTDSGSVRSSRTFAIKMSPVGIDLFLDCHYRLCQQTNELLPYGQTLYCAMLHLRRVDPIYILDDLATLGRTGLGGSRMCFVGAPLRLQDVLSRTCERIDPGSRVGHRASKLFLVALKRFRLAVPADLMRAYEDMIDEAGEVIKIPAHRRIAGERQVTSG